MRTLAFLVAVACASPAVAQTACRADSGETLTPLVELYTSEGCDSCPPADRWLSANFPPDRTQRASVLAFHVDYWDRLGWTDRFADAAHTERQYAAMRANRSTFVYTPQILLQGRDYTGWRRGPPADALAIAASRTPRARLSLEATIEGDTIDVRLEAMPSATPGAPSVAAIAYTDSRLKSHVGAGENRGATLVHDHVVRHFATHRMQASQQRYRYTIPRPREAGEHARLVAFVQDTSRGDVLQSLSLDLASCR